MSLRLFYPCEQVAFAKDGTQTFIAAHGVQQVGITTNFNLDTVFELGQLEVYQIIEQIPDIEVNMEKLLDGYPLLFHLATNGATGGTLIERSNIKCTVALSIFNDTQSSALGAAQAEVHMSGLVINNVSYAVAAQGNASETISLVGNSKAWRDSATLGSSIASGVFTGNDQPLDMNATSGNSVQQRQHVVFVPPTGGTYTLDANGQVIGPVSCLPREMYGITSSGTNPVNADGTFLVPIQNWTISADLGRETVFELGTRAPYAKFVNFPVEVRSEFEVLLTKWDNVSGTADGGQNGAPLGSNLKYQSIRMQFQDGTVVDAGTRNKLNTVTWSGGDATTGGGNVTGRYSYTGFNKLTVSQPQDPSLPFS